MYLLSVQDLGQHMNFYQFIHMQQPYLQKDVLMIKKNTIIKYNRHEISIVFNKQYKYTFVQNRKWNRMGIAVIEMTTFRDTNRLSCK